MHNIETVKLGKLAPLFDPNAKKLASYVTPTITVPVHVDNGTHVQNWGMMMNDQLGCCTAAGVGHLEQVWTSDASSQLIVTDQDVVKFYSETTGYVPGDSSTDNGGIEVNILNYWKRIGFRTVSGVHKISGWTSINPHNILEIKAGIYWFGGVYVGVALPLTAQNQEVWDVTNPSLSGEAAPGTWGGHCIILIAYNAIGPVCITWGQRKQITWAWWNAYGDEAYAILSNEFISKSGTTINGLNLTQLQEDLKLI